MQDVLAQIDMEIAKLQQARTLLAGAPDALKPGRGRPKGSKNAAAATHAGRTRQEIETSAQP